MAKRKQQLKVFKTPIGFHDAYVAAPSRKAALAAWGAGTDLFSAGIAELVTDGGEGAPAALAKPGEVVRVERKGLKDSPSTSSGRTGRKTAKAKARPSRATLDKSEAAMADLEAAQAAERAAMAKEEEVLAKRQRAMVAKHGKARERAEAKRDAVSKRYRQAMAEWDG
jgi:hypothetical protein